MRNVCNGDRGKKTDRGGEEGRKEKRRRLGGGRGGEGRKEKRRRLGGGRGGGEEKITVKRPTGEGEEEEGRRWRRERVRR